MKLNRYRTVSFVEMNSMKDVHQPAEFAYLITSGVRPPPQRSRFPMGGVARSLRTPALPFVRALWSAIARGGAVTLLRAQ